MATLAITAFAPSIFAKSIFAPRRANKSIEAEDAPVSIMNGCVAAAQLAKAGEGIIGIANDTTGSLASRIVNIDNALREVPKTDSLMKSAGHVARYGMEHINGLIGATALIKAACSDDKESTLIQETAAVAGMLGCEKTHKLLFGSSKSKRVDGVNQIEINEGFLAKKVPMYANAADKAEKYFTEKSELLIQQGGAKKILGKAVKYVPSAAKGISFAGASITGYCLFHYLGGIAAEKITGRKQAA